MPVDPSNLVGIWCAPCGGFLFFHLIFRPDGMGLAEAGNCVLTNALVFDWQISGDDLLIGGREVIELNESQDGVVRRPLAFQARVPVALGSLALENGDVRRTLNLSSAFDEDWPLEYVAGNPKHDVFNEPDFSWLKGHTRGD